MFSECHNFYKDISVQESPLFEKVQSSKLCNNQFDNEYLDLSIYNEKSMNKFISQDQPQQIDFNNLDQQDISKNLEKSLSLNRSERLSSPALKSKNFSIPRTGGRISSKKMSRRENLLNNMFTKQNQQLSYKSKYNSEKYDKSTSPQFDLNGLDNSNNNLQLSNNQEGEQQYFKLVTFCYAYKFLKSLFIKYINKEIQYLSEQQRSIINDKSDNLNKKIQKYDEVQYHNIFERLSILRDNQQKLIEKKKDTLIKFAADLLTTLIFFIKLFIKTIQIIKPNNIFLKIWDLMFIAFSMMILNLYPLYSAFFNYDHDSTIYIMMQYLYQTSLITNTVDMLLNSQTGIYVFGEIVLDRKKIYKQYISQQLSKDLFCLILLVYGVFSTYGFPSFISLIIRLTSIKEKLQRMRWRQKIKSKLQSYYDLIILAITLFILIHIFGCGFYYVGRISVIQQDEMNWIRKSQIEHSPILTQYLYSIYFITITMVTIGYGDITPTNSLEIVYTITVSFISCGLFGFCINLIGTVITEISKKSKDFQKKQETITKYLSSRNIQYQTQIRVLKYLEYLDESQEENILEGNIDYSTKQIILFNCFKYIGQNILQSCSKDIREDILKEYFGVVVKKSRIVKETFSKDFIEALSLKMEERSFAPGEVIIERGQKLQHLYFVTKGQTEYFFDKLDHQKSICFYDHDVIDLRIFMGQQASDISIRSKGITIVSYIDHQTFIDTLKQYQIDYVNQDQFLNDERYQYPCKSCGQFKHNIFDCPQISYSVDTIAHIKKITLSFDQKRNQNFNRQMKKCRSLLLNSLIKKKLKIIRYDIIRDIYDGFDDLQKEQSFFESNYDKEFLLLLPKINSQKLIDGYKALQEDQIIEYDMPKQINSLYNIQIKQQFMDDVLEFTNSVHSSQSSDLLDLSYDSIDILIPSKKSIRKDSEESKQILEEFSLENETYSENSDKKLQHGNLKQQKFPHTFQLPQHILIQNYIEQNKCELSQVDSENKREVDQKGDFYLKIGSGIKRESEQLKKELSLLSYDRSSRNSEISRNTDNQGKPNDQQNRDQQRIYGNMLKEDNKRIIDKYATSEFKKKAGQRSQQRHSSYVSQKQNCVKQVSLNSIVECDETINNGNANNQFSFSKIKSILEQETLGKKGTFQNTIDNQLLSFPQNFNQINYFDQIKYILEFIEFKTQQQQQQLQLQPQPQQSQINKSKDAKDKLKKQFSLAYKQNKIRKSNNSQSHTNKLQPPSLQQQYVNSKSGSIMNSAYESTYLHSYGTMQSKQVSQHKPISIPNQEPNHLINIGNTQKNVECLFGKCGYKFEQMKEFEYYYPKFNYTFVIKAYKKQTQYHNNLIKQQQIKQLQSQRFSDNRQLKQSLVNLTLHKKQKTSSSSFIN